MSRLIDADELKSLYSKEEKEIRSRLFSVIDRTPEHEESKYKKLAEQYRWERDLLQVTLDSIGENYIPVEWLEKLLKTDKILMNYKLVIYEIIEKWREENENS